MRQADAVLQSVAQQQQSDEYSDMDQFLIQNSSCFSCVDSFTPKLHHFDLLWICCTTSPQQIKVMESRLHTAVFVQVLLELVRQCA